VNVHRIESLLGARLGRPRVKEDALCSLWHDFDSHSRAEHRNVLHDP
jgi:hypothetical protein